MDRLHVLEDLKNHANLKGTIFKRKLIDPNRYVGMWWFAGAGLTYAYFPVVAAYLGSNLTIFGITAAALMGMHTAKESSMVNSISYVNDGEHAGKLKFNVSTGPFTSKDVYCPSRNA